MTSDERTCSSCMFWDMAWTDMGLCCLTHLERQENHDASCCAGFRERDEKGDCNAD